MAAHPLPQPRFTHLADVAPRPRLLSSWERIRHRQAHWFVECCAEAFGVFLYVFAGVGSQAGYVLGNLAQLPLSSIFQIGLAYAMGIVLAIVLCAGTSGGHFNPAVTIAFVITKKFPPLKALRYIIAQILGGYIACLVVYVQYEHLISTVSTALSAAGKLDAVLFTPSGPAGIFALYVLPGSKLGQVFLNEFVCDFVIGITIWGCFDPTNFMVSPIAAPWLIGMTYAMAIWGYSPIGLAANAARDVGGRLAVLTLWGRGASGGSYAAISSLTNIPATLSGILFYEVFLRDSSRVLTAANVEFFAGHKAHEEHKAGNITGGHASSDSTYSADGKVNPENIEVA
ncbi:hypothetical protein EUX98_g6482 [Antrodiella citrinella]|uniref:Aquaporin n=1 Tax=Antrodiella citrinella TaxID=2447956 RepID=A0A4S4MPP1_9APHY|nr:hypothetical protein EUX98_g6482 [Antrodiella citrinella]